MRNQPVGPKINIVPINRIQQNTTTMLNEYNHESPTFDCGDDEAQIFRFNLGQGQGDSEIESPKTAIFGYQEDSQRPRPSFQYEGVSFAQTLQTSANINGTLVAPARETDQELKLRLYSQLLASLGSQLTTFQSLRSTIITQEVAKLRRSKQTALAEMKFHRSPNLDCTNTTCSICLQDFEENEKLWLINCLHRFHAQCLMNWMEECSRSTCPICKCPIESE